MTDSSATSQHCPAPAWAPRRHPLTPQALLRSCFLYPAITQNPQGLARPPIGPPQPERWPGLPPDPRQRQAALPSCRQVRTKHELTAQSTCNCCPLPTSAPQNGIMEQGRPPWGQKGTVLTVMTCLNLPDLPGPRQGGLRAVARECLLCCASGGSFPSRIILKPTQRRTLTPPNGSHYIDC